MIHYYLSARSKNEGMPVMDYCKKYFSAVPVIGIAALFGFVEFCTLYGGRLYHGRELSENDVAVMYDHGIGLKLPLTNHYAELAEYGQSKKLLEKYHRKGNTVIVTNDDLAHWIRNDYPLYTLEASVIKDLATPETVAEAMKLYDRAVLPVRCNDDPVFLSSIPGKERITLFGNTRCPYNCPCRICYEFFSRAMKGPAAGDPCSAGKIPRNDPGVVTFDIQKLSATGFSHFKILNYK
jgi:hypothetical protein